VITGVFGICGSDPGRVLGSVSRLPQRGISCGGALSRVALRVSGLLAIVASLAAPEHASGAMSWYSSFASWDAAVAGSRTFDFDFPDMIEDPGTGMGRFRDQYADWGIHGGFPGGGNFSIQPHLPLGPQYFESDGVSTGLEGTYNNFTFDTPIHGLAFHLVTRPFNNRDIRIKLYSGGELVENINVGVDGTSRLFNFGQLQGGAGITQMFAFSRTASFDRITIIQLGSFPWPIEAMYTPSSVPAPASLLPLICGMVARRRRR
jgi:hypothetical protein